MKCLKNYAIIVKDLIAALSVMDFVEEVFTKNVLKK